MAPLLSPCSCLTLAPPKGSQTVFSGDSSLTLKLHNFYPLGYTSQGCISVCMCVYVHAYVWMLSCFSCVQLFATLWTIAFKAPLSVGFSRQEYWSGLPFPPPGDLPDPRIEPKSPVSLALAGRFFTTRTTRLFTMAEDWRIHVFELWCWRRLIRVPWTARIPNQSILEEINPEYSL